MTECVFCGNTVVAKWWSNSRIYDVECENCGIYKITELAFHQLTLTIPNSYNDVKHLMSGYIRECKEIGYEMEAITKDNVDNLINTSMVPKNSMEKLDKLLLYYYHKNVSFGQYHERIMHPAICYANDKTEIENFYTELHHQKLIALINDNKILLTSTGLKHAYTLEKTIGKSNKVFIAMKFNDDMFELKNEVIQPAIEECGYKAYTINDVEYNGGIVDKIIAEIKTSKFLIADISENNSGVYFEAGYAMGMGIPVIFTFKEDALQDLHFDVKHYNFVTYTTPEDLKERLINRIKATIV